MGRKLFPFDARARVCAALALLVGWSACSVYDPELIDVRFRRRNGAAGDTGQLSFGSTRADSSCGAQACLCPASCRFAHGIARCPDGRCELAGCELGYADCNGDPSDGCERSIDTTRDCGACDRTCPTSLPHGVASCDQGTCVARCDAGYGDCNGTLSDGCELALQSDGNCGACSVRCGGAHVAAAECRDGACAITRCVEGFEDCDDDASDGCESDLLDARNCGSCRALCALPHVVRTRCDLATDGSGTRCLIDRSCGVDELDCTITRRRGCEDGFSDCDGDAANGCEADLRRNSDCGGCGISCMKPHALTECRAGECVITGCSAGADRCTSNGACQSLQGDPNNCGACGNVCPTRAPQCIGGKCTAARCRAGFADCDGNAANGCETNLNDPESCGGCAVSCQAPHASAMRCDAGSCSIGACEPGFGDCDADPSNGCEVELEGLGDCGACGRVCLLPQAVASCSGGTCHLQGCADGRGDCNGVAADGCEDDLRSPRNCGRCGNDCSALPHVASATCDLGSCQIQCRPGFADCDGSAANGCETSLSASASCGSCDNDCGRAPHVVSATCPTGACGMPVCERGFGDCDGGFDDGCETMLKSLNACGSCGAACVPAHASAPDCSSGACRHGACDAGFGDCDGNAANGCETALDSVSNCGGCGIACERGAPCKAGKCGCVRDATCSGGQHCCDHECVDVIGTCFPWPCIPGTDLSRNKDNCGACGAQCGLWCCGPLL